MRTIGLIGGTSWESTVPYYTIINEAVNKKLGGLSSAKIVMYSVNFEEVEKHMSAGDWGKIALILGEAAQRLEAAGADFIVICSNTMHKITRQIQRMVEIPIIHIADAAADEIDKNGFKKIGLLGTKYTMTQNFYRDKLTARGYEVYIPDEDDIKKVDDIIFNELCRGIIKDESRETYKSIIAKMQNEGVEGVILGCTEIGMLVKPGDVSVQLFDTTIIHALKAVDAALA